MVQFNNIKLTFKYYSHKKTEKFLQNENLSTNFKDDHIKTRTSTKSLLSSSQKF